MWRVSGLALATALPVLVACPPGKPKEGPQDGAALFASACARCHGTDGAGGLPLWEGGPSPANLRTHTFQTARTDEQLKRTIVEGKPPGMPPFGTAFTDPQLTALVTYVRSLDSEKRR